MGIYDRDYYRGEGPSYLDRLIPSGQVCKWLIVINAAVFLLQVMTSRTLLVTNALILDTSLVFDGQVWRLLTYAFAHDPYNLWHIVFNMLFLWWFGSNMESMYGPREFLSFYLVAALLGGVTFAIQDRLGDSSAQCLGASGAVTATLVLFAFHFPRQLIYVFFFIPVPIWAFVVFQVGRDLMVFLSGEETRTAVSVHLAGAAFGALYFKNGWHLTSLLNVIRTKISRKPEPRLRVYDPEEEQEREPVAVSAAHGDLDEHLEAKLDAVLEKVARTGQGSLTEKERQILLRASEIYKRKRS